MPPTRNVPPGVTTSTAADFGNGSVVMMAIAASAPPSGESAAAARGMPSRRAGIFRLTPMTPVEATSTSSAEQPSAAAVRAAISCASAMPWRAGAGIGAAAVGDDRPRPPARRGQVGLRQEHRRRLRQVGREDRRRHGRRVAHDEGQVVPAARLDAAVQAGGAKAARRGDAAFDDADRVRHGALYDRAGRPPRPRLAERQHDGLLFALAEERARLTVGHDLLLHPVVRHDREAHPHEIARAVREGRQRVEALHARAAHEFVHQLPPDALVTHVAVHDQRAHLGDRAREWRQFRARHEPTVGHRHDEARRPRSQFRQRARQQMPLFEMGLDERQDGRRLVGVRRPQRDRRRGERLVVGQAGHHVRRRQGRNLQAHWAVASAGSPARTASSVATASSMSVVVTV